MFLLKKLSVANAIKPVPSDVSKAINRINAVRNGLAHSFYPETRKENRATGKVLYGSLDIRTPEGLSKFQADADVAHKCLEDRVYGPDFLT
jgi:hypothetical protein